MCTCDLKVWNEMENSPHLPFDIDTRFKLFLVQFAWPPIAQLVERANLDQDDIYRRFEFHIRRFLFFTVFV